jgi:hypothetical protein
MPTRLIPNAAPLPSPTTIGDLIDLADGVSASQVIPLLPVFVAKIEELRRAQNQLELERHFIVLGALVNRAIFEVCALPKDRQAIL